MSEEAVGGLTDRIVVQLYVVGELLVHSRVKHHTSIGIPLVVPTKDHEELIPEFLEELMTRGRIYAYRFRPEGEIKGRPIDEYKGKCLAGKAFQVI